MKQPNLLRIVTKFQQDILVVDVSFFLFVSEWFVFELLGGGVGTLRNDVTRLLFT